MNLWCCIGESMVLHRWICGVVLVNLWCCIDESVASQIGNLWCCIDESVALQFWIYGVALMNQWCCIDESVVLQLWIYGVASMNQWCCIGESVASLLWICGVPDESVVLYRWSLILNWQYQIEFITARKILFNSMRFSSNRLRRIKTSRNWTIKSVQRKTSFLGH